jgi:hypothetical protein
MLSKTDDDKAMSHLHEAPFPHADIVHEVYEVLPKSSGNLNSAREPVVVRPSAARCAEQYPL